MKKKLLISIIILFTINSFNAYAQDIIFNKEKLNVNNIASSILQNDNNLEITLNGDISLKNLNYTDNDDVLDFVTQNIDNDGFYSYFVSNETINNSISFSSHFNENSNELTSKINVDLKQIAYVNGKYNNKSFNVATSSIIPQSFGFFGNNPINVSNSYPFEIKNDVGILSCNFSIYNIFYIKDSYNIIKEIKGNFIFRCNFDKSYINDYKYLYILIHSFKNQYYVSNFIDLSNYEICNHNYIIDYSKINHSGHSVYCTNCKWTKIENHNYHNTYDGINNNQCDCGYNHKINLYIYNENNTVISKKTINSFSSINSELKEQIRNLLNKDGYIISKYNEQRYIPENEDYSNNKYQWVNNGYVSNIPDYVNNVSLKYIPIYEKINSFVDNNNLGGSGGNSGGGIIPNDNLDSLEPIEEVKLFGDTPITTNYKISKGESRIKYEQSMDSDASKYTRSRVGVFLKDPYFSISDNNQNSIDLNLIDEIKMEQDNDYYYFDVKLDLKNEDLTFNSAQDIGNNEYQSMGNSTLYLSNTDNNSINYEYKITEVGNTSGTYTQHYYVDFFGTSGVRQYEAYNGERIDAISLSINGYTSNQQMSMKDTYTSTNHVTNRTYTKNDLGTNSATSTATLYNTLTFPYETYLNGNSYFIPQGDSSYITSFGNYNGNIWSDSSGLKYIKGKILFTNGQTDFTTPHKLTYNHIVNQVNTHDTLQPYFNEKITTRIKIKKSDINNYRYLNLYNPTAISKSKSAGYYSVSNNTSLSDTSSTNTATSPASTFTASSIHSSSAIDLLPYTNCEHEYVIKECKNENTHIVYCNKCKWEHEENHNFIYEYDGIINNLCACGYIHNIKHHYEFNSSNISDYNEILIASSSYTKPKPTKTGYKLIGYKKYLKYFENMTNPTYNIASTSIITTYIEDITKLPDKSDYFSTVFKAKYEPIKYKVHFNNNNNKSLPISIITSDYDCYYDLEYETPIYDYGDYIMEGWSIASGSNVIKVNRNDKIKNLSIIDNDLINLYPIYNIKYYTFKFSKENNLNLTINTNINDLKCYFNTNYTLPNNININGYTFIGWSLAQGSKQIDLKPNANIYNYTTSYGNEIILYPVYEKNKIDNTDGSGSSSNGGGGNSNGGSGGGSSSNRISNNTKPIENTTINITQPIFNYQSNKQNNKSKKEIKSKKTLYTFVSEVYDYYKQSLLIKTKNNLIEFIGRVYNKYKRNRTR